MRDFFGVLSSPFGIPEDLIMLDPKGPNTSSVLGWFGLVWEG